MKAITLLGLAGMAFVSLSQPTWAGPRGGGGGFSGGHVGGGGRVGGFAGGGSRAAPAFNSGSFRSAPAFRSSGAYFANRSMGGLNRGPSFYYGGSRFAGRSFRGPSAAPRSYYGGRRMSAVRPNGFNAATRRAVSPNARRVAAMNRQPNRTASTVQRSRVSNPRTSALANRQSFLRNHASERHDAHNWQRDWDKHRAHFHNNRVFVFVNGFWWGLYPWDYYDSYPYYASSYPYDYNNSYPYDYYNRYPYDYYNYDYDDQSAYAGSNQSVGNATVSAVQSELSKLGYYNGAIDGVIGDETEAALARYQQDQDLSVSGTVDTATLQSLGIGR